METDRNITTDVSRDDALFRFLLVSKVRTLQQQGLSRSQAIRAVSAEKHHHDGQKMKTVSSRSLYRWMKAYETKGFDGLSLNLRRRKPSSWVISRELLDFFKREKEQDPLTSLPELIRRARERELISEISEVNRTTLWRCLGRMGVNTRRRRTGTIYRDKRRFAYPHRMDMVLCDGKHFRAGVGRLRRVALFFLDDATRLGLEVVVGTSETTELFLRGVYDTILRHGIMSALYVDNGSGFSSKGSTLVLKQLGVLFIHGEVAYPSARGKIERFNQTASMRCLRNLDSNPTVDPTCSALQLRLRHFLFKQYNHTPHEGLKGQTPWERFHSDTRSLRFRENAAKLKADFVLHHRRRVSHDNIVSFKGVPYEMPIGYEGAQVILRRHMIEKTLSFIHQGREMILRPPDVHANALSTRSKPACGKDQESTSLLPESSAQIAFNREYRPIVDQNGGFTGDQDNPSEKEK